MLVNKGDQGTEFLIEKYMQTGRWVRKIKHDDTSGTSHTNDITESNLRLQTNVASHGVQV